MQTIVEKTEAVVNKYKEALAAKGITITVSKRYFETNVEERIGRAGLFNTIDRAIDRKVENKKRYNYQRNRYHCIVLSVLPAEKGIVRREYCKEYAFVLKKVERAHIGMEPRKISYEEEKLLRKIEKRIVKILSKAQKNSTARVCKDTFFDALRYTSSKYGYKRKVLNTDRANWELIFLILGGAFVFIIVFLIWMVR